VGERPDITVVGAGIIGCAVAYELGRRGADVRVIDRRNVGCGATQASAGVLAPFIEADHPGPLRALGVRSLELYDEFVADVVADSGDDVPYERSGTLEVATDETALSRLERARQNGGDDLGVGLVVDPKRFRPRFDGFRAGFLGEVYGSSGVSYVGHGVSSH